jgi:hypothetical protein
MTCDRKIAFALAAFVVFLGVAALLPAAFAH